MQEPTGVNRVRLRCSHFLLFFFSLSPIRVSQTACSSSSLEASSQPCKKQFKAPSGHVPIAAKEMLISSRWPTHSRLSLFQSGRLKIHDDKSWDATIAVSLWHHNCWWKVWVAPPFVPPAVVPCSRDGAFVRHVGVWTNRKWATTSCACVTFFGNNCIYEAKSSNVCISVQPFQPFRVVWWW